MRVHLVGLLRKYGPSTATRLAERLGVNSGPLATTCVSSARPVSSRRTRNAAEHASDDGARCIRINALGDSPAWAGIPLGGLLAGAAVASAGLVPVLLACGTVYFLTRNLTGLRPEWREMDRPGGRGFVAPHADETSSHGSANVTT